MKISLKNNNYFKYLVLIKGTRNVPLSRTNDTIYSVFCLQWKMSSVEDDLHGGHMSLDTFCLPFFYVSQQENCCCSISDGSLPGAVSIFTDIFICKSASSLFVLLIYSTFSTSYMPCVTQQCLPISIILQGRHS